MKTSIGSPVCGFCYTHIYRYYQRQRQKYLRTSDSSPYLDNVNEMIDNLKDAEIGESTCNPTTIGCGEAITNYSGEGGAAFMLCGSL